MVLAPKSRIFPATGIRRLWAVLCMSLLTLQTVWAEVPGDIDDVAACRSLVSDTQRLLCYDTVVDGGVFTQQQAEQAKVERFGSSEGQADVDSGEVEKLTVTVVRVQKSETGIHYFYTADDHTWKQTSRGNWSLKTPFEAEIKAGFLGAYFLVTEGGKSMRVKRVK